MEGPKGVMFYEVLRQSPEEAVLAKFTEEEQKEIIRKKHILSSLAYFIGKDFEVPMELGLPSPDCPGGWMQGKKKDGSKFLQMNAYDLLTKPIEFLRFVVGHEAGHARISRFSFIPMEVWQQPGFSFMQNSIEDPRDNNFVAESYPKFIEQMESAYAEMAESEVREKERADRQLGYRPRFMLAGFEYIKQWFRERQGKGFEVSADLPEEVKEVVLATLESARDSWWRYPSRQEADRGEDKITEYAKVSYEINLEEVWPEFKRLVEMDLEDQKMMEAIQDMMKEMLDKMMGEEGEDSEEGDDENKSGDEGESDSGGKEKKKPKKSKLPKELKDKLTSEEQEALENAIGKAIDEAKKGKKKEVSETGGEKSEDESLSETGEAPEKGKPVDLSSLSEEIRQKIKDYIDSLPEDEKKKLVERAKKAIKEFERKLNEEIEGKLSENPEERVEDGTEESKDETDKKPKPESDKPKPESEELKKYKEKLAKELSEDANVYEKYRREVMPLIQKLENELREIFIVRRSQNWQTGFRTGKKIDIKKRIQEKAKGVSAMESVSWQKREAPEEKDYSITLLVDLSGSMQGENIEETFKAVIVLAEVLNRLSINVEVLGFNNKIYVYQGFGQQISKKAREDMGGMLQEVYSPGAMWNDDGWAVTEATARLKKQKTDQKFLIVLSDGEPIESPTHPRSKFDLSEMIKRILKEREVKLVGLGVGENTGHVSMYYPHSMANVGVEEMADKIADLIKEIIVKSDRF